MPMAQHTVTARPAPALTPMMLGDASWLASTFWITAPDTARALPARRQAKVRGKRTYQRILAATVPPGPPTRASHSSERLSPEAPMQRFSTAETSMNSAAMRIYNFFLLSVRLAFIWIFFHPEWASGCLMFLPSQSFAGYSMS